jgi:hypothetical protein
VAKGIEPAVKRRRLTVEAIAAANDRPEIEVVVPEWGDGDGEVFVVIRGLSYDQLALARQSSWDVRKKETNEDQLNAWCLSLGIVEPAINFETAKGWICDRSFGAVNTILTEILTASGLGKRAQDDAKSATT